MTDDPELQELFTDPAHQELVDLLKSSRPAEAPLDPHFRSYLRAKLMTEAQRTLPRRSRASAARPWFSLLNFKPRTLALSMAAVAAGFLVVLGVQVYLRSGPTEGSRIVAVDVSKIANKTDVPTEVRPIQLTFSGPVDKNAVAESVVIEPATSVTKTWVGSTLVIIPNHPLAPNTTYTVRLQPKPVAPSASPTSGGAPTAKSTPPVVPTPVVVHFTTVRAPIPPVVPPTFTSSNVTWVSDSRLANSGTILNAAWTSGRQLLATRPAGQLGPGQATPSATATTSASPSSGSRTDVWLLSPSGTALRNVAPGATLPSTPVTGSLFSAWTVQGDQARLDVKDLLGSPVATVATITGTPDRPAIWLGTDRLAYVDAGVLKIVDLQGNPVSIPTIAVTKGSVAASADGSLLAVESNDKSIVLNLSHSPASSMVLKTGATGFAWSSKGDLAYVVQQSEHTDLYVVAAGATPAKVAASAQGQTWSDPNWAPDAASLLLATRPIDASTGTPGLTLIDRDGGKQKPFGAPQQEYSAPRWSPGGDLVLFTRHDEATGGITFQVATASTSGVNAPERQAIAEVTTFMDARLKGDGSAAQAELDSNGISAYQANDALLLSPSGSKFDRYYPVTVQLEGTTPNKFLIGVRTFISRAGAETSFFEEQLIVLQQDQRYVIHGVTTSAMQPLDHGPTVVGIEILQTPPDQQVRVRFDSDLKADSVNSSSIEIKDASGAVLPAQVSFDPNDHLAVLTVRLHKGTYELVVTTAVTDIDGLALPQEYDAPLVISR